jgi:hypothetical protein
LKPVLEDGENKVVLAEVMCSSFWRRWMRLWLWCTGDNKDGGKGVGVGEVVVAVCSSFWRRPRRRRG